LALSVFRDKNAAMELEDAATATLELLGGTYVETPKAQALYTALHSGVDEFLKKFPLSSKVWTVLNVGRDATMSAREFWSASRYAGLATNERPLTILRVSQQWGLGKGSAESISESFKSFNDPCVEVISEPHHCVVHHKGFSWG
jgi:hypothetical protein